VKRTRAPKAPRRPDLPPWPRVWNGGPERPEGAPSLTVEFDCPTSGESNARGFWTAVNRKKKQDATLDAAMTEALHDQEWPMFGPWCVRLTRIAPKALDDDNLGSAFKRVRDRLCLMLGVDDRSPAVAFALAQEKGPEQRVRVEVWGPTAVPGWSADLFLEARPR